MPPRADRRRFLGASAAAFAALTLTGCRNSAPRLAEANGYGPLRSDPAGLLDLPAGFSYRLLSRLGETMADGARVPDAADGMGCLPLPGGKLALIRNHELEPGDDDGGAPGPGYDGAPGGTTTLVIDAATLTLERQFRSLSGTIRNCAGGVTPWGSWLSCEEDVTAAGPQGRDHGWVFEVPAAASGLVDPVPLRAMGRFRHEAAAVDPRSGAVYLTEDREDGLLYRFLPTAPGRLAQGGRLQALGLAGDPPSGWPAPGGGWARARWIDLDAVESPDDDLRQRGAARGAFRFVRGEGIHLAVAADGASDMYFTATTGGAEGLGQVWRLRLGSGNDALQLFYESDDAGQFHAGDNLTVTPGGELLVCEDQGSRPVSNHLRGITREGRSYAFARLRLQTELAGACFSPDGRALFVNVFSPAQTLAITGPWGHLPR